MLWTECRLYVLVCCGQVYYGEWKGQEVAVKVMSAEASHQNVVLQEVSY